MDLFDGATSTWQKTDDGRGRAWEDANNYCNNLSLGGSTNWTLPTINEVKTIVDPDYYPTINPVFTNTLDGFYWSSTFAGDNEYGSFYWSQGFNLSHNPVVDHENQDFRTRCMRKEISSTRYVDNGNGTVSDNVSGLVWQQTDDNQKRDWYSSVGYCNGLTLGGSSNWRLPTLDELLSLVDTSESPTINPVFTGVDVTDAWYWSSTTDNNATERAWDVTFSIGDSDSNGKVFADDYVRCVR